MTNHRERVLQVLRRHFRGDSESTYSLWVDWDHFRPVYDVWVGCKRGWVHDMDATFLTDTQLVGRILERLDAESPRLGQNPWYGIWTARTGMLHDAIGYGSAWNDWCRAMIQAWRWNFGAHACDDGAFALTPGMVGLGCIFLQPYSPKRAKRAPR